MWPAVKSFACLHDLQCPSLSAGLSNIATCYVQFTQCINMLHSNVLSHATALGQEERMTKTFPRNFILQFNVRRYMKDDSVQVKTNRPDPMGRSVVPSRLYNLICKIGTTICNIIRHSMLPLANTLDLKSFFFSFRVSRTQAQCRLSRIEAFFSFRVSRR